MGDRVKIILGLSLQMNAVSSSDSENSNMEAQLIIGAEVTLAKYKSDEDTND